MILITDVHTRKGFDVYNICRNDFEESFIICSTPNINYLLNLAIKSKILKLRTDSQKNFNLDLANILENSQGSITLVPVEEITIELFYQFQSEFNCKRIVAMLPDEKNFHLSRDKLKLALFCIEHNINVPKIYANPLATAEFPLILKPRVGSGSRDIFYINNKEDISKIPKSFLESHFTQKCIANGNQVIGAFFLCLNGEVTLSYCHKRLRCFPSSGGVTLLSETITEQTITEIG
jgi:carbamoyl-phosphate synthase large subunit